MLCVDVALDVSELADSVDSALALLLSLEDAAVDVVGESVGFKVLVENSVL
jgi:hypothetical protein